MFEEFKDIFMLVLDAAEGLTWVAAAMLVGYGLMQIILTLGTGMLIYFGAVRLFDTARDIFNPKEKVITTKHDMDGFFITSDGAYDEFMSLIRKVKKHRRPNSKYGYLHRADVEWLVGVVEDAMNQGGSDD